MDVDQDQGYTQSLAGALIIAGFLNWGLLGILVLQIYTYYIAFPRDRLSVKILVYSVLVLELAQSGIVSHDIYVALGSSFGDATAVDAIHTHWWSIPVSGGTCGGIGQVFFSYRIWKITDKKSRGTPIIIGILALASCISALICASTFFRARNFSTLLSGDDSFASVAVWNGIGAICDITIALTMPYYIMRHGTGLPPTHIRIVKVVRLIIETGGLTAIFAILHLCLYFSNSQAFIVPGLTISKLYANTMLVILNNRIRIVDGREGSNNDSDLPESPRTLFANHGTGRHGSTILVHHDRLVFRLNELERTTSVASKDRRQSHPNSSTEGVAISPVAVSVKEEKSIHFDTPPVHLNSEV